MEEQWRQIPEFPDYSVSDIGRVQNMETGRIMALTINQAGVVNVGLTKDLVQYKRSVTRLVALAFLPPPDHEGFDTPINVDGDRTNNHAVNLMWRPRWFAIEYHAQFKREVPRGITTPIIDLMTGETYPNSFEAAKKFGLLDREILLAVLNDTWVWPTWQYFALFDEE